MIALNLARGKGSHVRLRSPGGLSPGQRGETSGRDTCPDIWELDNGAFAVIGTDVTEQVKGRLPEGMHCAPYERVVIVTRRTLIAAKRDLPDV